MHVRAVLTLAELLYKAGFRLNHAHATTTIPKSKDIPLWLEYDRNKRHHFELAFEIGDSICFVDVVVIRKSRLKNG